jgi:hypothetical protein
MATHRYSAQEVATAVGACYGLITLAARQLGCTRQTVFNYAHRFPSVRAAIEQARAEAIDLAEAALFAAVERGEPWAVQFLLRGPGRHRGYGEKYEVRAEITVSDPKPKPLSVDVIDFDDYNRRCEEALRAGWQPSEVFRLTEGDAEAEDDAEDEPDAG